MPGVAEFAWAEDRMILDALARRGIEARLIAWRDGAQAFEGSRLVVVRTPWDYPWHLEAFLAWTRDVAARTALWNPPALLRWNTTKDYLDELRAKGIPTVPGDRVPRGARYDVAPMLAREQEIVVKPVLDSGGRNARRFAAREREAAQAHLDAILRAGDALVQPYLRAVATEGERSLVFFNGAFSHAVRKLPSKGEFRIHAAWGGTTEPAVATESEVALARRTLALLPTETLHARVDVLTGNDGAPVVIEVEVLEPYLFLADAPGSADRFAAAIAARLA